MSGLVQRPVLMERLEHLPVDQVARERIRAAIDADFSASALQEAEKK